MTLSHVYARSNDIVQGGCRDVRAVDSHVVVHRAWATLDRIVCLCEISPVFACPTYVCACSYWYSSVIYVLCVCLCTWPRAYLPQKQCVLVFTTCSRLRVYLRVRLVSILSLS